MDVDTLLEMPKIAQKKNPGVAVDGTVVDLSQYVEGGVEGGGGTVEVGKDHPLVDRSMMRELLQIFVVVRGDCGSGSSRRRCYGSLFVKEEEGIEVVHFGWRRRYSGIHWISGR